MIVIFILINTTYAVGCAFLEAHLSPTTECRSRLNSYFNHATDQLDSSNKRPYLNLQLTVYEVSSASKSLLAFSSEPCCISVVEMYPPIYPPTGVPPYNQAFPGQNQGAGTEMEWSTGLCGCGEDPGNCCITCCCPCITVGQIAEVLDRGTTSCAVAGIIYTALLCVGVPCIYSCGFRAKLRNLYSLKEGSCGDCCLHCWCDYCAICQEYRELKIRGVDPTIGWQGNVAKWNRGGSDMPPVVDPTIGWQGNVDKSNRGGSTMTPVVATGMYR